MSAPNAHSVRAWLRRVGALTGKELLQLRRDTALVIFYIYGFLGAVYLAAGGVSMELRNAEVVYIDNDRSYWSRELVALLREPYFRPPREVASVDEGINALDSGRAMVFLDIPPRFEELLREGRPAAIQLQVDTSNTALGYLAAAYTQRIVADLSEEASRELGPAGGLGSLPALESRHRVWFNPNQNNAWFHGVEELVTIITLFSVLLPAAAMAREKERGTIEQLLVCPLSPWQIMLPKVMSMTIVVLAGAAVSVSAILMGVFDLPMRGSVPLLVGATVVFVVSMSGLGLLLATLARSVAQVGLMSLLIISPLVLLSGAWTPPEAMPAFIRLLPYLSPMHHYFEIAFGVTIRGAGLDLLWDSLLAMAGVGAALLAVGVWRFRRQFD